MDAKTTPRLNGQGQLDTGTSANTNTAGTLDTAFADPDKEILRQKMNEIILNGRR